MSIILFQFGFFFIFEIFLHYIENFHEATGCLRLFGN